MKASTNNSKPGYATANQRFTRLWLGLCLTLLVGRVWAQTAATQQPGEHKEKRNSPIYVKVFAMYGVLTPGSYIPTPGTSSSGSSFKVNSRGLGGGIRVGGGIGFVLNDFVNVGVDADQLIGETLQVSAESIATTTPGTYTYVSNSTSNLRVITVTPNITFKALAKSNYYIYTRLGIMVGKVTKFELSNYAKANYNYFNLPSWNLRISEIQADYTYKENSLAIGYQAALGVQFRVAGVLRGFIEVVGINQSFKPQQQSAVGKELAVFNNGTQKVTPINVLTKFVEQGSYQENTDKSINAPAYNIAMNSIGLGVGLLVRL